MDKRWICDLPVALCSLCNEAALIVVSEDWRRSLPDLCACSSAKSDGDTSSNDDGPSLMPSENKLDKLLSRTGHRLVTKPKLTKT